MITPNLPLLILVTALFISNVGGAADLRSQCTWTGKSGSKIEGQNLSARLEIASVSKVMTSYWALRTMGLEGRFKTTVHIRKVNATQYDLHFSGGHDPFTGREMIQFLVAELNRQGIESIRQLSFDENFKFFVDVRSAAAAQGHFGLMDPSSERVVSELRDALGALEHGYDNLIDLAHSIELQLPPHLQLQVEDIRPRESASFNEHDFGSRAFVYRSAPVLGLLKEMNRNSNNHAANQIFESLGGASAFRTFLKQDLGLNEIELRMVNGSGDRFDLPDGKTAYNEATCGALLKLLQAMQSWLKKSNHSLADVLSVVGSDAPGESSRLTEIYSNIVTNQSLVAKTGTVNPAITLAGILSTSRGVIYFAINCGANGSAADWTTCQGLIRNAVTDLFQKFGGSRPLFYEPIPFLPFDRQSGLQSPHSLKLP